MTQEVRDMASSPLGKLSHSWTDCHTLQTEREDIIGASVYKEKRSEWRSFIDPPKKALPRTELFSRTFRDSNLPRQSCPQQTDTPKRTLDKHSLCCLWVP